MSANFGLAATIVQERAPGPLRGRISAIFGMSFFGLTPVGSLVTPAFADLVGLRTALVIGGIIYGTLAVLVLGAAGRAGARKRRRRSGTDARSGNRRLVCIFNAVIPSRADGEGPPVAEFTQSAFHEARQRTAGFSSN